MAKEEKMDRRRQFGDRVAVMRREAHLSQEELAHKAGIDRAYTGRIERGEVSAGLDKIWALADALGVNPAEFFE